MDLRAYYNRLRAIEAQISGDYAVIVSEATPDGGRAGVMSEVSRAAAARMVTELRARLATPEESESYRKKQAEIAKKVAQEQLANRMQLTVISESELAALRERIRPQKG